MSKKNSSTALRLVKAQSHDEATEQPKISKNAPICKEDNCSSRPQVGGFCRLHYLKILSKAKSPEASKDSEETEKAQKWNRRRGNRASGFETGDSEEHSQARDAQIEHFGSLDGDIPTILDSEELRPFKKTG